MGVSDTTRVLIDHRSAIGAARSATRRLGPVAGLTEQQLSDALVVATELATNVVLHAGHGHFVVRAAPGLMTLLTWDQGPGIPDVERAFRDGYSTSGTAGNGLGAVRRMSTEVQVRSSRDAGTVVVADLGARRVQHSGWLVDGLAIPMSGEGPSGDAFGIRVHDDAVTVVLADGLGHGEDAGVAAGEALGCLFDGPDRDPVPLLEAMGSALRRTRGAAVSVARLEHQQGRVRFAGVGNVTGLLSGPGTRKTMLCFNGIVGREVRHLRESSYPLGPQDGLVLHTDGVRDGWTAGPRPDAPGDDPLLVAATIVRELERGRDDVGVVIARRAAP